MENSLNNSVRKNRTICLPIKEASYMEIVQDSRTFRLWIDENITNYPGLFPPQIQQGYLWKSQPKS